MQEGKIDVLIGTHRKLSTDVKFKELGLLVVDEEQRFGVRHKEKIKRFRASVEYSHFRPLQFRARCTCH
ncbi:MAG: hypothetical protein CM1200mP28_11930 [Deltaproteobacteria bacterium]|nr:MAG: hypothetical protein CM1200mP28_11930 [Deltaproteobacteria bacterium]